MRASLWGLAAATMVAAVPAAARAETTRPTCTLRGVHDYARKADTPRGALAALGLAGIAERGARWQATDVIGPGPRLPGRRFVAARLDGCVLTVRYEQGGIAHTFHSAVAQRRGLAWIALPDR
jgi:hypothetical protein